MGTLIFIYPPLTSLTHSVTYSVTHSLSHSLTLPLSPSSLSVTGYWPSPITNEFPSQRPVTQSFDVFFDLRLNTRLSIHSWGWWFEMPSRSLWRHCNEFTINVYLHNAELILEHRFLYKVCSPLHSPHMFIHAEDMRWNKFLWWFLYLTKCWCLQPQKW